jgi:hypothetical protein
VSRLSPTSLIVLSVALYACGCVAQRRPDWRAPAASFGGVSDAIVADLVHDGDAHWQWRAAPAELDEAVRAWAAALRYQPRDPGLLVRLGRAALRRGLTQHRRDQLDLAVQLAERALAARNAELGAAARAGKPPEQIFALAAPPDAPALVLYAEAELAWALAYGTPTVLAQRDAIRAAAESALRFDRSVGWAAPDRVLGTLACEIPEARHNLGQARDHFEAAVAAAPAYLPSRLAFAEEYAPRVHDVPLRRRLLEEVVVADARALPDAEPENREAQRVAQQLLRRVQ